MATIQPFSPYFITQSFNLSASNTNVLSNITNGAYYILLNSSPTVEIGVVQFVCFNGTFTIERAINCLAYNTDASIMAIIPISTGITYYLQTDGTNFYLATATGTSTLLVSFVSVVNTMSVSNLIKIDSIKEMTSGNGTIFSTELKTSGIRHGILSATASMNLIFTHDFISCIPSTNITLTLPNASSGPGKEYTITNLSTNIVTLQTTSPDTINNGSSTSTTLSSQYSKFRVFNDGTIWFTS